MKVRYNKGWMSGVIKDLIETIKFITKIESYSH